MPRIKSFLNEQCFSGRGRLRRMRDGRGVGESGKKFSPDFKLATDVVFADDVEVGEVEVGNFCFESLSMFGFQKSGRIFLFSFPSSSWMIIIVWLLIYIINNSLEVELKASSTVYLGIKIVPSRSNCIHVGFWGVTPTAKFCLICLLGTRIKWSTSEKVETQTSSNALAA